MTNLQLSSKQDEAVYKIDKWYNNQPEKQVFKMFGYAGTGKTTLAKHIAEKLGCKVMYAAFTGKAAYVLQEKGCVDAKTIHQLIYRSQQQSKKDLIDLKKQLLALEKEYSSNGMKENKFKLKVEELTAMISRAEEAAEKPYFVLNPDSDLRFCDLLIIDECSMLNEQMAKDLLTFNVKLLVLGDPAQLPPVKGSGYFIKGNPDILLTEVHRQVKDSPIIKMASIVRTGGTLPLGHAVKTKSDLTSGMVLKADQIIVGKNKSRFSYNKRIRELKGFTSVYPQVGDKLVCLRNDHEVGLLNGGMWIVEKIIIIDEYSKRISFSLVNEANKNLTLEVESHTHHFTNDELPFYEKKEAQEFDFGYVLTCHKSQGSQWNRVLVFDESHCFRSNASKWLYTAITRAAKQVIIIR